MADIVSPSKRSRMMAGIRSKNTKPELLVRRALHRRGLRFRLHRKDLPGNPDLFFPKHKTAIFVNGCFWHGHDCKYFKLPKTNPSFWKSKIETNAMRDVVNYEKLEELGVRYTVVWECSTKLPSSEFEESMNQLANWLRQED